MAEISNKDEENKNSQRDIDIVQRLQEELVQFEYDDNQFWQQCLSGKQLESRDVVTLEDGSRYDGEWLKEQNIRQGRGKLIDLNGEVYEGYWLNDKRNGKGRQIYNDGDVYTGQWKDNSYHGNGEFVQPSGSKYNGEWKDGKYHGLGLETWPDGTTYKGLYSESRKHG